MSFEHSSNEDWITRKINMLATGIAIGVAVAVVLCAAVLAALALIGMKRYGYKLASYVNKTACGTGDEKQEMEWDNSALTITVNPLETDECMYQDEECGVIGEELAQPGACRVRKEEQGEASEQEEDEEEVEIDAAKSAVVRELEWDDSTLSL